MSSVATTEPARGTDPGTDWGAPAPAGDGPTFVVGIGNPILGDDGIGWRVVQEVERRWASGLAVGSPAGPAPPPVVFLCVSLGGLALMERLVGASCAILVDAVTTRSRPVGSILVLPLAELVPGVSGHLDNAHDASLPVALAVGRSLGAELPTEIMVVGIEARRVDEFGEELSPPVAAALPGAVEAVLDLLRQTVAGSR